MRISDWSSGVCSSDLLRQRFQFAQDALKPAQAHRLQQIVDGPATQSRDGAIDAGIARNEHHLCIDQGQIFPELNAVAIGQLHVQQSHIGLLPFDLYPGLAYRSEEHTSELQSLMSISYAVFCLK